jgi:hypothetical protein
MHLDLVPVRMTTTFHLDHKRLDQDDHMKGQRLYDHPFGLCPILNTINLCCQNIVICAKYSGNLILVDKSEDRKNNLKCLS